jgi:hypothetical protein
MNTHPLIFPASALRKTLRLLPPILADERQNPDYQNDVRTSFNEGAEVLTLPTQYRDYQGQQRPIPWPEGAEPILRCGDVFLVTVPKALRTPFAVGYGLEVTYHTSLREAAKVFDNSVLHQRGK